MDKKQVDPKSVKIRRLDKKIRVYSDIVTSISELSAASIKKVGCMAIKNDFSKMASFGYNGSYPGASVYEETGSIEESLQPGQSGLIHAEINMVAKFQENNPEDYIVILTLSPCKHCTKVLCTAGFKYVYWLEEYRINDHFYIFDDCKVKYGDINQLAIDYPKYFW
jgi:deoxycytidylate deaminase